MKEFMIEMATLQEKLKKAEIERLELLKKIKDSTPAAFIEKLEKLEKENADLKQEVSDLEKRNDSVFHLFNETHLRQDSPKNWGIECSGPAAKIVCASLVQMFVEMGGKNYLELTFQDPETYEKYDLLIQKNTGKTVAQVNTELQEEVKELKTKIEALNA